MNSRIKYATILLLAVLISVNSFAQNKEDRNVLTQTIRGIVIDRSSGYPMAYATVALNNQTEIATTTDDDGNFSLENVPVGRHDIQARFVGYEPAVFKEVLVTSAKEVYLEIGLKENIQELNEVVVRPQTTKEQPLNKMATTGARMLSVEEASRYAGGMDDPARLVGSFAGVASGLSTNGISVHGNAPHLLQWRLEDVEIPNPNHFADISVLGGGVLSSLSSHVLGNSDFFTGAFPAEYSNAVSGVFDMKLRNGNNQRYQNTLQLGVLGIDFASEGPFSKKSNASYIFNYRYSTTSLLSKTFGMDMGGVLDYQDLNFKMNFPTKKAGIFSVWGTALIDKAEPDFEEDPAEWEYKDDAKYSEAKQTMGAAGISHRYFFDNNSLLKTTLATTYFGHSANEDVYAMNMTSSPYLSLDRKSTNVILTSSFNKKYSTKHTNQTGFTYTKMYYDMNLKLAPFETLPLETLSNSNGNTDLISAYTSSSIGLNDRISLTLGLTGQVLTLNNKWTLEPRAGIKWKSSSRSSFALAYGLHSRMEKMDVYFVKPEGTGDQLVNKNLDFTKTHHLMLSYNYKISDNINLRIEPYFQYLYDVPVDANGSYSVLNRKDFYIDRALVNKGKGRNMGVDITLERYLNRGLYYMITATVFDSKYCGGDGIWHNTKFNRNFIVNSLVGKEWMMGRNKQNILSVNLKATVQGGDRYSPVDIEASLNHPDLEVQYDESKAYSKQFDPQVIMSGTVCYKINRRKLSHEFAIKAVNFTGAKEYYDHEYNLQKGVIEPHKRATSLPNISYKLEF